MSYKSNKITPLIVLLSAIFVSLASPPPADSYTTLLYKTCEQGNNVEKTVERVLPTINILEISGELNLNVKSNQTEQYIRISGDENILPFIATTMSGNKLLIHPIKPICTELGITVDISMGSLTALIATSSGEVKIHELYTDRFSLVAEGSGDIELTGYAGTFNAVISGSGDLESRGLRTQMTTLNISGSSSNNVHASKSLRVAIVGMADVYYSGDPREVIEDILGAGSLNKIE